MAISPKQFGENLAFNNSYKDNNSVISKSYLDSFINNNRSLEKDIDYREMASAFHLKRTNDIKPKVSIPKKIPPAGKRILFGNAGLYTNNGSSDFFGYSLIISKKKLKDYLNLSNEDEYDNIGITEIIYNRKYNSYIFGIFDNNTRRMKDLYILNLNTFKISKMNYLSQSINKNLIFTKIISNDSNVTIYFYYDDNTHSYYRTEEGQLNSSPYFLTTMTNNNSNQNLFYANNSFFFVEENNQTKIFFSNGLNFNINNSPYKTLNIVFDKKSFLAYSTKDFKSIFIKDKNKIVKIFSKENNQALTNQNNFDNAQVIIENISDLGYMAFESYFFNNKIYLVICRNDKTLEIVNYDFNYRTEFKKSNFLFEKKFDDQFSSNTFIKLVNCFHIEEITTNPHKIYLQYENIYIGDIANYKKYYINEMTATANFFYNKNREPRDLLDTRDIIRQEFLDGYINKYIKGITISGESNNPFDIINVNNNNDINNYDFNFSNLFPYVKKLAIRYGKNIILNLDSVNTNPYRLANADNFNELSISDLEFNFKYTGTATKNLYWRFFSIGSYDYSTLIKKDTLILNNIKLNITNNKIIFNSPLISITGFKNVEIHHLTINSPDQNCIKKLIEVSKCDNLLIDNSFVNRVNEVITTDEVNLMILRNTNINNCNKITNLRKTNYIKLSNYNGLVTNDILDNNSRYIQLSQ